jgi:transcriptional regulator with XRE-family HTH domain/quercetin dioxygenase-like cupin family protein
VAEPVVNLGARLREVRLRSGMSLREVARQLGVSPSFVSQLENGKSQPSVATLYSMAQLLGVSIDELFDIEDTSPPVEEPAPRRPVAVPVAVPAADSAVTLNRSDFSSPVGTFPRTGGQPRVSVSRPGERPRLVMDTGVVWERLANNTGNDLDFIEVTYPPRSSSTNDDRMLQHAGSEFGYLVEGELEITVGFDVFTLRAGEALGFDSAQPHLLRNLNDVPARGIWFVRHPHV